MTDHEPQAGNDAETLGNFRTVQYEDGQMGLLYDTPGQGETLGLGSERKWARNFFGGDMAIITTESGNMYGIGDGIVVDGRKQVSYDLSGESFDVTVGASCDIPGAGTTTKVKSLLLRYKIGEPGSPGVEQRDKPNPFARLDATLQAIAEQRQTS